MINPGNSGAPLVDAHGLAIGIETVRPKLSFAIPINQAVRIAEQLIDTSRATQTTLGVRVGNGGRLAALNEPPGARPINPRRIGSTTDGG